MNPTAPELLAACAAALATPPSEEDAGAFEAGKLGVVALLNILAAQECATGVTVRVAENRAIRALLAEAEGGDGAPDGSDDGDLSLSALDAANAALRLRLIRLHEAAEAAGDHALDRRIIALYAESARARELHLPPTPTEA